MHERDESLSIVYMLENNQLTIVKLLSLIGIVGNLFIMCMNHGVLLKVSRCLRLYTLVQKNDFNL